MQDDPILYRANITMVLLCALTGYWLLVSPLVPYEFHTETVLGLVLFVLAHQLFTAVVGGIGVVLNGMTVRDERVTRDTLRQLVRRSKHQ